MHAQATTGFSRRRIVLLLAATAIITALTTVGAVAASSQFFDVNAGDTHEDGIGFMADSGVTVGCAANAFCPDDPVTRAQMATFMYRLSGTDPNTDPSVNAATLEGLTVAEIQEGLDAASSSRRFAVVDADDTETTLLSGEGVDTVSGGVNTEGRYTVTFEEDVNDCAFQATSTPTLDKSAHVASVMPGGSDRSVSVHIVHAGTGVWANAGFHLTITC